MNDSNFIYKSNINVRLSIQSGLFRLFPVCFSLFVRFVSSCVRFVSGFFVSSFCRSLFKRESKLNQSVWWNPLTFHIGGLPVSALDYARLGKVSFWLFQFFSPSNFAKSKAILMIKFIFRLKTKFIVFSVSLWLFWFYANYVRIVNGSIFFIMLHVFR
jgi:hypothetical protein